MIKISRLRLNFGRLNVLDIASLNFAPTGFYALVGPSGCGKTSLLNVIGGIIDKYEGQVVVNHKNLNTMKEQEKLKYRQSQVSLCYQDAVLFDDLTVEENIGLKLDFYPNLSFNRRQHKINELLKELQIYHLKHKKAKYLSGGEKQRVAIIRALINEAKILLFDEPTAALDEENARLAFALLRKTSREHLVIVVTHNRSLVSEYANQIIDLSYGKVTNVETIQENGAGEKLRGHLQLETPRQQKIKDLLKLAWNIFKSRQRRNVFASLTFTFSLTAICALLVLTSSISSGIRGSFALNYQEDTALIKYKKQQPYPYKEGVNKEQATILASKHNAKLGALYLNDIDLMFPTMNNVYFQTEHIKLLLPTFSAQSFNNIIVNEEINIFDTYGYRKTKLLDDEIMLTLPISEQRYLYDHLNLRKGEDLQRLGDYLKTNVVSIVLNVANEYWQYEDEQIFRLVGVTSGERAAIIHSNCLFSETLFETQMTLLGSTKYSQSDEYPWTLKKMFYLFKASNEILLISELNNPHILLSRLAPSLVLSLNESESFYDKRVCLFKKPPTYMPLHALNDDSFLLVNGGLTTYEDALMLGFSDNFLLGISLEQISEVVSYDERRAKDDTRSLLMGPKMANGHISLSLGDGLTFMGLEQLKSGREPLTLDEIVVSDKLFTHLFAEPFMGQKEYYIYVASPNHTRSEGDYIYKDYTVKQLKVTGLVKNSRHIIYHHYYWPLLFYKDVIKVDPFLLIPTGLITRNSELISSFKTEQDFTVSYPFASFAKGVEKSISQMVNIIYLIAFASLLMSFIVIFLVLQTLIDDFHAHFSLLYLFGHSRENIVRLGLFSVSFVIVLAIFASLLSTFLIEIFISKYIFSNGEILKNLIPYGLTVIISLISLIPGYFLLNFKVKRLKLRELSKTNL